MIALRLTRDTLDSSCTRGVLEVLSPNGDVKAKLFSMEKPWIPNTNGGLSGEPFKSCVSVGTYDLSPFVRPSGDKVWVLENRALDVYELDTDIPEDRRGKARFLILIHAGNFARDIVGCIAPGLSRRTTPDGIPMVTSSRDAMRKLHSLLDGRRRLEIEIRGADDDA